MISERKPSSLFTPHTGAREQPGKGTPRCPDDVFPGEVAFCSADHLLAVYPQAAEPAIVFCCALSDGKQVPAIPDRFSKSPGLRATAPSSAAALLLSQTTTTKDSSPPSICLGFNSLLAHLSWAIKHARDEPRDLPLYCILFCRAGRGKAPSPPRSAQKQGEGDVPRGGMRPSTLPEQSGSVGRAGAAAASFCPCNATSCSGAWGEKSKPRP